MPEIESETHDYDSCAMPLSPHCQNYTNLAIYNNIADPKNILINLRLSFQFLKIIASAKQYKAKITEMKLNTSSILSL